MKHFNRKSFNLIVLLAALFVAAFSASAYADPSINIEKSTNGEDADAPPGPAILVGEPIMWEYVITNSGDEILSNITVTDDQLGVICEIGTQTPLVPGASQTCSATGTASEGQYENIAHVVAYTVGNTKVEDEDYSHYLGIIPVEVPIDIKPGSDPNSINLGSNGLIPVAILSSQEFDATSVNPDTVMLAGAGVELRGKGSRLMAHEEDVNGDGLVDLVMQVGTANLDVGAFQDGYAILTGQTFDGVVFEGQDEINIVPPE